MRYWRETGCAALALLAGCAGERQAIDSSPIVSQSPACRAYSQAWVEHFRANVAALEDRRDEAARTQLVQARTRLRQLETDEACYRPYCLIQPRSEGRLDAYCGYKVPDSSGAELYRWIPWSNLN